MAEDDEIRSEPFHFIALFSAYLMQLAEYVADQYRAARQAFYSFGRIETGSVVVSFDRKDRRNLFQSRYYFGRPDVARVNDEIDVLEEPHDGLVKLAMGIRDHAYFERLLHLSLSILWCRTRDPQSSRF
jgi:hypothetical protein